MYVKISKYTDYDCLVCETFENSSYLALIKFPKNRILMLRCILVSILNNCGKTIENVSFYLKQPGSVISQNKIKAATSASFVERNVRLNGLFVDKRIQYNTSFSRAILEVNVNVVILFGNLSVLFY